jgi:transcriptional regulator with XRE-family HTH domain
VTAPRDTFGPRLRAHRERQGVSLQAITESTKISVSLLVALERNDLMRWPKGICRRAFFREYAAAIGLSPEPTLAEFVRLFPEDPMSEPAEVIEFRLMLASDAGAATMAGRRRALVALAEVCGVLFLGSIAAWALDAQAGTTSGVIALLYYPVANACGGRAPRLRPLCKNIGRRPFEWLPNSARMRDLFRGTWRQRLLSLRRVSENPNDDTPAASEWGTASN